MTGKMFWLIGFCLFMLLACEETQKAGSEEENISKKNDVQVYGALRAMFHQGKTGAEVTLDSLLPDANLYAVGAIERLAGEITILGGKAYLSYPAGEDSARIEVASHTNVGAVLLVSAKVGTWKKLTITSPIIYENLDAEIEKLALQAGLSVDARFPFLLEGEFQQLAWHVIDGRRLKDGGTSHQDHLAAAVKINAEKAPATLLGFYSQKDQGIFTHRNAKTHLHCVLESSDANGHVDHVLIPAGTMIKFPENW